MNSSVANAGKTSLPASCTGNFATDDGLVFSGLSGGAATCGACQCFQQCSAYGPTYSASGCGTVTGSYAINSPTTSCDTTQPYQTWASFSNFSDYVCWADVPTEFVSIWQGRSNADGRCHWAPGPL